MLYREGREEWKWFALGALLHVSVIFHSAVNMQPLNDKLTALGGTTSDGKGKVEKQDVGDAVDLATKWIRGNYYRVVVPMISGSIALWNTVFA